MKRRFLTILLCLLSLSAFGQTPAIRDIDISVTMATDGSIDITEVWDVCVAKGTEWYLVRYNLGDIDIKNLAVSDETGRQYVNEGRWDVDRNISQKAGKCGLVSTKGGYEICWGVGSYGDHVYTVSYTMTNAVKSLIDEDMIHLQFISDELSSTVQHAKLTLEKPGTALDTLNSSIWAFGYNGYIWFEDGKIMAETEAPMESNHSMIVLARFEKGIFEPTSVRDEIFEDHLQRAREGSDYTVDKTEDELSPFEDFLYTVLGFILFLGMCLLPFTPLLGRKAKEKKDRKDALGQRSLKNIAWSREIPYGGNVEASYKAYVEDIQAGNKKNSIAGAMVLKLIKEGYLYTYKDAKDKTLIMFNESKSRKGLPDSESRLFDFLLESSGEDKVLQDKEFSKWASCHKTDLISWNSKVTADALKYTQEHGFTNLARYTESGKAMNRSLIGFKKYLEDFTIINERQAVEAPLWQDYLIFASIFGIADKVAKDLKDINPTVFEETVGMEYTSLYNTMRTIQSISNSVRMNSFVSTPSSYGGGHSYGGGGRSFGGGGHSSFGGGGGFSGGGHGGGSR